VSKTPAIKKTAADCRNDKGEYSQEGGPNISRTAKNSRGGEHVWEAPDSGGGGGGGGVLRCAMVSKEAASRKELTTDESLQWKNIDDGLGRSRCGFVPWHALPSTTWYKEKKKSKKKKSDKREGKVVRSQVSLGQQRGGVDGKTGQQPEKMGKCPGEIARAKRKQGKGGGMGSRRHWQSKLHTREHGKSAKEMGGRRGPAENTLEEKAVALGRRKTGPSSGKDRHARTLNDPMMQGRGRGSWGKQVPPNVCLGGTAVKKEER